jgi:transcriptional regulator with XRE-family HTH domain
LKSHLNYTDKSLQTQTKVQNFFITFADAFSNYISINGIKQSFIVKKTGIDKTSISHYASGKFVPGSKNKEKIEQTLGVSFVETKPNRWEIIDTENSASTIGLEELNSSYNSKGAANDLESIKKRINAFREPVKDLFKRFDRYNRSADDMDMLRDACEKIEDLLIKATKDHLK